MFWFIDLRTYRMKTFNAVSFQIVSTKNIHDRSHDIFAVSKIIDKPQCAQKVDFTCFIRRFLVGMLETCWRLIVGLYATLVTCWLFDKFFPYLLVSHRKLIVYTSMFCIFAQRHYNVSYQCCLSIGNIWGSLTT